MRRRKAFLLLLVPLFLAPLQISAGQQTSVRGQGGDADVQQQPVDGKAADWLAPRSPVDADAVDVRREPAGAKDADVPARPSVRGGADNSVAHFGEAVAVGEDWAFVGEPDPRFLLTNAVYAYRKVEGEWIAADTLTSAEDGEDFGTAVVLDGSRLFVGAPSSAGVGAVYVFRLNESGTEWTQSHLLRASSHVVGAGFGTALDAEGDLLVVGAPFENENNGAAYVFTQQPDESWTQGGRVEGTRQDGGLFGFAVAVSGPRVVVGAQYSNAQAGVVYSFSEKDATGAWLLNQELVGSDVEAGDRFGRSIDAAAERMIVGSPLDGYGNGTAYAFAYDTQSSTWMETDLLQDSEPGQGWFGWDVAMSPGQALIGSAFDRSAHLFVRAEGTDAYTLDHVFSDPLEGRTTYYGYAVDVSANHVIVGARAAESAVIYERTDAEWQQAAVLAGGTQSLERIEGRRACTNGRSAHFPCDSVDLMAFLPIHELGTDGTKLLNDVWGWTDPVTGTEYALVGRTDGTAFVDLSDPEHPVLIGSLPTRTVVSDWRDVKVVNDHAVIVADNVGSHGMQVFDLALLRETANPPVTFEPTAVYEAFGSAHNVAVNDESDHAYLVGITGPQDTPAEAGCGPGPHIVDMSDPVNPQFAGCYNPGHGRGYTHDAQCVRYRGPDTEHAGSDLCFGADEVGISITDVSNPAAPEELSLLSYPDAVYTHQGWLTEDHRYFLVNDELDESSGYVENTRTLIFDVQDLAEPVFAGAYLGETTSIDHNLYVHDGKAFESNYTAGLRILDLNAEDGLSPNEIQEVGYFDVFPRNDNHAFSGSWSNYPYFESGIVILTGMESGFYVVVPSTHPDLAPGELPAGKDGPLLRIYPNPTASSATVEFRVDKPGRVRVGVFDALGRLLRTLHDGYLTAGAHSFALEADGLSSGVYFVRAAGDGIVETASVALQRR